MKKIAILSLILGAPLALLAHHSAAAYDTTKEVKITGTIKQYSYKNPHVYMVVEVKEGNAAPRLVEVEAGAPSVLNPLGFTINSVKVGEVVTISGNPSRDASGKTMLGRDLNKSDGKYLPLNISSRSVYEAKGESARTIAGTWF